MENYYVSTYEIDSSLVLLFSGDSPWVVMFEFARTKKQTGKVSVALSIVSRKISA